MSQHFSETLCVTENFDIKTIKFLYGSLEFSCPAVKPQRLRAVLVLLLNAMIFCQKFRIWKKNVRFIL